MWECFTVSYDNFALFMSDRPVKIQFLFEPHLPRWMQLCKEYLKSLSLKIVQTVLEYVWLYFDSKMRTCKNFAKLEYT